MWIVFTDGASSGNPGPGGWSAILVSPDGVVSELGGREVPTTNNRMEMAGPIEALRKIQPTEKVGIYTDSSYLIRGITQWIWGWKKRGWITAEGKEVANTDLWKQLASLTYGRKLEWHYVRGHAGIPGNERCDEIAVQFSKGIRPRLYSGPLIKYDIPIHDIPEDTALPASQSGPGSKQVRAERDLEKKKAPFSYLSCVGNEIQRHATWKECESRVRGQPRARFKKAMSEGEEEEILKSWGFNKRDLKAK